MQNVCIAILTTLKTTLVLVVAMFLSTLQARDVARDYGRVFVCLRFVPGPFQQLISEDDWIFLTS